METVEAVSRVAHRMMIHRSLPRGSAERARLFFAERQYVQIPAQQNQRHHAEQHWRQRELHVANVGRSQTPPSTRT